MPTPIPTPPSSAAKPIRWSARMAAASAAARRRSGRVIAELLAGRAQPDDGGVGEGGVEAGRVEHGPADALDGRGVEPDRLAARLAARPATGGGQDVAARPVAGMDVLDEADRLER